MKRVPVLVLLLGACIASLLPAAERPVRATVLALVRSTLPDEDPELRSLLLNVCRIEVESRELEMVEPADTPAEGEDPLVIARKAGVEFALAVTYTAGEQDAAFEFSWHDVERATRAGTVSRKATLDFTLDVSIASAVSELLDGQAERIASLPLKPDPAALAAANGSSGTPSVEVPPTTDQVVLGGDIVRLKPLKRLAFTLGASPLISTFGTSDLITEVYFGLKFTAAWRFPLLGGAGGIGLASGLQRYYVDANGYFTTIPVGAEVHYATRMSGPFDFVFRIDGGWVVWFFDPDSGNASSGGVPYLQGGVGFIVNVLDNLGLALSLDYALYFYANKSTGTPNFTFLEPGVYLVVKF